MLCEDNGNNMIKIIIKTLEFFGNLITCWEVAGRNDIIGPWNWLAEFDSAYWVVSLLGLLASDLGSIWTMEG